MLSNFTNKLRRFTRDASGATAIEYGLIVAGIAVVIGGAIMLLGPQIANLFGDIGQFLGG